MSPARGKRHGGASKVRDEERSSAAVGENGTEETGQRQKKAKVRERRTERAGGWGGLLVFRERERERERRSKGVERGE